MRKKKETNIRAYPCDFVQLDTPKIVQLDTPKSKLMDSLKNEFKGKTVIVTGASGFIGKALVYGLLRCGAKVYGGISGNATDSMGRSNDHFWRHMVKNWQNDSYIDNEVASLKQFTWDMTIPSQLQAIVPEPDYVFHLAAVIGGIKEIHEKAASIMRDNSLMLFNLYDCLKEYKKPPKVIMFSTCTVFEKLQDRPFNEGDLATLPPPSLHYAFQKLFCEQYTKCMWEAHKIPYTIVRPFNTYGPGEISAGRYGRLHVIPDLIQKCRRLKYENISSISIFGDGKQVRSYTYIEDLAVGIMIAASQPGCGEYNVTTMGTKTVLDIIHDITLVLKIHKYKVAKGKAISGDVRKRMPAKGKLQKLGWFPKFTFETGIKATIKWTNEVLKNDKR